RQFLLVTEGNSDTNILKRAFGLLRPQVSDFFGFIDMENGYPFTGTGNLGNFCRGLVKIGVLNNILVIYDNDTEGTTKLSEAQALSIPANMRVTKLPDMDQFRRFRTVGPNGVHYADINGRAVAIECFLDLLWQADNEPQVRWTSYNPKVGEYQGELERKERYTKAYLQLRSIHPEYNYDKLERLVDTIIQQCTMIAADQILKTVDRSW